MLFDVFREIVEKWANQGILYLKFVKLPLEFIWFLLKILFFSQIQYDTSLSIKHVSEMKATK